MRFFIIHSIIVLFVSSCSPTLRQEPTNLVWPLPPNPPKIKYVKSIYSEDDIGRIYTLGEWFFGKDYHDRLSRPYGVFARRDKLVVSDLALKAVFIFSLDSKRLQLLGSEVAMELPTSAIMDAAGTTYVADAGNSRIVVYDAQGNYKTAYLLNGGKPVALAVNEILNRLYVVDRRGHKVVVLSLDGKMLFEFGGPGEKNGLFNIPLSIALDDHGDVYMLDSGNFRVQIFTSEGEFLSKFGEVGDRQGMFANPKGVAVDSDGNIYVTDAAYSNFQIFDRRGRFLLFVGTLGPYPGQMHLPGGIAIDESDRIYLADQLNGRIEVFQYLKTPKADY